MVLSGNIMDSTLRVRGKSTVNEVTLKSTVTKYAFLRKQDYASSKSVIRERIDQLLNNFSQKLDPIDWQTYEPYLWENQKQSYLRHAVLFGFFVQLNRMYMDTVQKLPTSLESNLMTCSTIPRFKYLPISAPALSSRKAAKTPLRTSDDITSRSSGKAYALGELSPKIDFDENSSFGVATPFLKSFMQSGGVLTQESASGGESYWELTWSHLNTIMSSLQSEVFPDACTNQSSHKQDVEGAGQAAPLTVSAPNQTVASES